MQKGKGDAELAAHLLLRFWTTLLEEMRKAFRSHASPQNWLLLLDSKSKTHESVLCTDANQTTYEFLCYDGSQRGSIRAQLRNSLM